MKARLFAMVVVLIFFSNTTLALGLSSDFRYGIAFGIGGTGIIKDQSTDDGQPVTVNRSDGPLVLSFFLDYQIYDKFIISLEDSRGIKFAPYSSGIIFTGGSFKWYYLSEPPNYVDTKSGSTLLLKRISPFIGGGGGIAKAKVERTDDRVPSTEGSGIYFSFKTGFDYQISATAAIRPEMVFASSLPPNYGPSTLLKEFSIQCGLYFFY
jgi:hypothetical protein